MTTTYRFSAVELEILREAASAIDIAGGLQEVVAKEGAAPGGPPNRLLSELRQQRLALAKLLAAIDLLAEDGVVAPTTTRARRAAEARWAGAPRHPR